MHRSLLILGFVLHLPNEQLAIIINADLMAAGLASLVQSLGLGIFGMRMQVMMGVTFAAVTPMIAIATAPGLGLPGVYTDRGIVLSVMSAMLLNLFFNDFGKSDDVEAQIERAAQMADA